MDLAIRASPSRTPKGRLVERPWIDAVFQSLAGCVGCPVNAPPARVACQAGIEALEGLLQVLIVHNVAIDSGILKKLFWYYCIADSIKCQKRIVHWPLIASLIELDASIFVIEPKPASKKLLEEREDLVEVLFDQISLEEMHAVGAAVDEEPNNVNLILHRIICPLVVAFERHRDILSFVRRWDQQLVKAYGKSDHNTLRKRKESIWEDNTINTALSERIEQSLTHDQIANLLSEHSKRMLGLDNTNPKRTKTEESNNYQRALSSMVIISAILRSIQRDETIQAVCSHLRSLLTSYASIGEHNRHTPQPHHACFWVTLCQLLSKLWPLELHSSAKLQQEQLHPLMKLATKHLSAARKCQKGMAADSSRVAAMLFLLEACHCLQTVSGSEDITQRGLLEIMKGFSSSTFEPNEQARTIECFCTNFATLLGDLDEDACRKSLLTILLELSKSNEGVGDLICRSLSRSIVEQGSLSLQNVYFTTLHGALKDNSDNHLRTLVARALLQIDPLALSRERRESCLDEIIEQLSREDSNTTILLSVMVHLMETPNATAKVSTNAKIFFKIAEQLDQEEDESFTRLQLFRLLIQSTLSHILPNENQAQNKAFLEVLTSKVNTILKAPSDCSAARLSILRAVLDAQGPITIVNLGRYVELLKTRLAQAISAGKSAILLHESLDAFSELTPSALESTGTWDRTRAWLDTWVKENSDLDSYVARNGSSLVEPVEYKARLHTMVAKFGLYPSIRWFMDLTTRFLQEPISHRMRSTVLSTSREVLASLPTSDRLALVPALIDTPDHDERAAGYTILEQLIITLSDKSENDDKLKQGKLALLPPGRRVVSKQLRTMQASIPFSPASTLCSTRNHH